MKLRLKIKKITKRVGTFLNRRAKEFIVVILIGLGVYLWLDSDTHDFGLNFLTEMIGVAVTIYVIDRLNVKREEAKALPFKIAAYEDVRLFTSRYISFWVSAYENSVPEKFPENIQTFFSNAGMGKIWTWLDLDSKANVTTPMTWWRWIRDNAFEWKNAGNVILSRHQANVDPEIYACVHQISDGLFNNCLLYLESIEKTQLIRGTRKVFNLGGFSVAPKDEDYRAILRLILWCDEFYEIHNVGSCKLQKVTGYDSNRQRKLPPKSMIKICDSTTK